MCGVIGYYSAQPDPSDAAVVLRLFLESKIRGRHAYGLAWLENGVPRTLRAHLQPPIMTQILAAVRAGQGAVTLLGHTRYSTSGDWRTLANNQPLHIGDLALVFNGVIDMRTRAEWEAETGDTFVTENDGELFLKHLAAGLPAVEFVAGRGSFAGCWFDGRVAYCLRNEFRPLWYSVTPTNALIIASTANILRRIVGNCEPVELPANQLLRLDAIAGLRPAADRSQQASRRLGRPPVYLDHPRYAPRAGGDNAGRTWLL